MLTISWAFLLDTVKSQRAVRIHFQSLLSAVNKGWSEMRNRLTGANTSNLSAWGRLRFVLWKALGTSVPPFVWGSWWSNNSHTTRTWKETKGKKKKKTHEPSHTTVPFKKVFGLKTTVLETYEIFPSVLSALSWLLLCPLTWIFWSSGDLNWFLS